MNRFVLRKHHAAFGVLKTSKSGASCAILSMLGCLCACESNDGTDSASPPAAAAWPTTGSPIARNAADPPATLPKSGPRIARRASAPSATLPPPSSSNSTDVAPPTGGSTSPPSSSDSNDVTPAVADSTTPPAPSPDSTAPPPTPQPPNPITIENALPGSRGFEVTKCALSNEIEGYASLSSATTGDVVNVFVNVDQPDEVHFELYRLGYYQGTGGRLLTRGKARHVEPQQPCPLDTSTGLIECAWQSAFDIDIDASYLSGYYIVKLISARGFESRVPFVVREAAPRAPVLVQASINTWQAYNPWGGTSLYVNGLPAGSGYTRARAFRVSYDRPYTYESGAGALFEQEAWMARWLEQEGYDVAYVTNIDIDREPALLQNRKIAFSVGHDEYNSVGVRDAFEAARDAGVSLAFLSANTGYWRVRQDPSSSSAPARILTCYKDAGSDPQRDDAQTTVQFRQQPFPRPEGQLEGVMYQMGNAPDVDLPLLVADPTSWVLEGTSSQPWERLANVLGPEWDQIAFGDIPVNAELVLDSPAVRKDGGFTRAQATVYYPTDHSFVFAAGTIDWARALGHPDSLDRRVQRMTQNLLARAGVPPRTWTLLEPAATLPPPQATLSAAQAAELPTAREVSVLAGTGLPGFVDGPADVAQFNAPSGIALGPDGALYVTEVGNHRIRRVATDGSVSTFAGCGSKRFREGVRTRACFDTPTAIAAGPDQRLFVSDTGNGRIRVIDMSGAVATFAGCAKEGLLDSPDPLAARFQLPRGLAVGGDGSVYVTEPHHGALRRIDPAGGVVTLVIDYAGLTGVAVGPDDSIYLTNTTEGSIAKWVDGQIDIFANLLREPGDRVGPASSARFRPGEGVLLDGSRLLIPDMGNYRLRELDLTSGQVTNLAGDGRAGADMNSTQTAHLVLPRGVAKFLDGYAVADTGNHRILYVRR